MGLSKFTSESVCAGHPDKISDQISDAIVDAVLREDPEGRVAVETLVTYKKVVIAGEVSTRAKVNFEQIARQQIKRLGYTEKKFNFSDKSQVDVKIHEQSQEIAVGVSGKRAGPASIGAGDQGMMFGFACSEAPNFMPLPIDIAHALTRAIDTAREKGTLPYLRPDGKAQVTLEYLRGVPINVTNVVVAVPHNEEVELPQVKKDILNKIVNPVLEVFGYKTQMKDLIVNGTGVWHIGGPASDTGLTGRKIVVDTYGGYARVGGGCFSGKDPTKVDRSGAYAARFIAKNLVANKLAEKAEVRLAYFIGARKPIMQEIETFGTAKKSDKLIADFVAKLIDTSVEGILTRLNLRRPIYLETATYGHFGRSQFPWEEIVS